MSKPEPQHPPRCAPHVAGRSRSASFRRGHQMLAHMGGSGKIPVAGDIERRTAGMQ